MLVIKTPAIVIKRINYGEADRIITVVTPQHGKLTLMVKGARRVRSKMAGAIELFSLSDISFKPGRGQINSLISARLNQAFSNIISHPERTLAGYDILIKFDQNIESASQLDEYNLLVSSLKNLNNSLVDSRLVSTWFNSQLLIVMGRQIELKLDKQGQKLVNSQNFSFDFEKMAFFEDENGKFKTNDIKILRLLSSVNSIIPNIEVSKSEYNRINELLEKVIHF